MPGGRVTFNRTDLQPTQPGHHLTCILTGPPERSGGVGGWETSERALRRPAKWWKGTPDDTLSLPCLVDVDHIGGPPVERRMRVIRDMGLPTSDTGEPPALTLDGDVWDDDKAVEWVLAGISWGDRLWNPDGTLRRQAFTVDLERYTAVSEIRAMSIARTRTGKSNRRRQRTVRSRGNDTLRAVALRELGDSTRWKDLQRWNKKLKGVDPDQRLRTGTAITLR